jgi:hypothetical protein
MYVLNGTGTMLYGMRNIHSDKSYIATKWITFFWVPLIPLGSYRVWRENSISGGLITLTTKTEYKIIKVKLDLVQVMRIYVIGIVVCFIFYLINILIGIK